MITRPPAISTQRSEQRRGGVAGAAVAPVGRPCRRVLVVAVRRARGVLGPGRRRFPFGGAHDDTFLATTAGPVLAAVGLGGGLLTFVMARGWGRGGAPAVVIGAGSIMAVTLAVVVPGVRPLMAVARTPLVLIGAPFGWLPSPSAAPC